MKRNLTVLRTFLSGLLLALLLGLTGCQIYNSSIPDSLVHLERNIYTYKLSDPGSYLYVDVPKLATDRLGFGGILIVHTFNVDENNGYCAFDLACPVEIDGKVRIGKPDQSIICTCDSCGEKYDLSFGQGVPLNHISKEVLRKYRVQLRGNDIIVSR